MHGYRDHVDRYLIPSLGRITLADLSARRLQACFDLIARQRTRSGTVIAASTVDRVRATLRSTLNAAVREGLIVSSPLAQVRLARPVRPHPVIWTDERVAAWRQNGIRPPVAIWTLRQLIIFLAGVEHDRLAALWVADRAARPAPRRGRRPGPRRPRLPGLGWRHGRAMFTYADGRPIRPEYLTHRFRQLTRQLGLPPIRLHDLRHGAATIVELTRRA
jgi:integrase